MTWARYDDRFTHAKAWPDVSYEARWHYLALVELCCATERWDGIIPMRLAERASDVENPEKCHYELAQQDLIEVDVIKETVRVVHIDDHIAPPGERPDRKLPRKRKNTSDWRRRKCERGEHTKNCPSDTCPVKLEARNSVTGHADGHESGHAGSGRVGSDREPPTTQLEDEQDQRRADCR